ELRASWKLRADHRVLQHRRDVGGGLSHDAEKLAERSALALELFRKLGDPLFVLVECGGQRRAAVGRVLPACSRLLEELRLPVPTLEKALLARSHLRLLVQPRVPGSLEELIEARELLRRRRCSEQGRRRGGRANDPPSCSTRPHHNASVGAGTGRISRLGAAWRAATRRPSRTAARSSRSATQRPAPASQ